MQSLDDLPDLVPPTPHVQSYSLSDQVDKLKKYIKVSKINRNLYPDDPVHDNDIRAAYRRIDELRAAVKGWEGLALKLGGEFGVHPEGTRVCFSVNVGGGQLPDLPSIIVKASSGQMLEDFCMQVQACIQELRELRSYLTKGSNVFVYEETKHKDAYWTTQMLRMKFPSQHKA